MSHLTVQQWIAREFEPTSRPKIQTVWKWIREGRLPATRLGRRYYIPTDTKVTQLDPTFEKILKEYRPLDSEGA